VGSGKETELYQKEHFSRAVGFVLRKARKDAGLSQEAAAEAAAINRQYLNRLENSREHVPSGFVLARLAHAYKIPPGILLERIEQRAYFYARRKKA
jgi:transcriptional regulator with XRE-family HTH domain